MTITVASYLMGIPPGNTNLEKPAIIVNFIEGVWRAGDDGTIVTDYTPVNTDVAVIQGFVHENSKNAPHLQLRKAVYENQIANKKRTIIVDSNLFLYADPKNTNKFLRYSYDGIFPNTGEYCNSDPDPSRWELIKDKLGIDLKPWNIGSGKTILICCQRNGGWSMNGQQLIPWLLKTIRSVQLFTKKPIVVRFHPGDKKAKDHSRTLSRYKLKNVSISSAENLTHDLVDAHAVISYNSSPGVVAAIEGVPVFVLDPQRSQASPVAHTNLRDLDNPREFDRSVWIQQMAQMHWTLDELKDGTAWKHLRQWAIK